MKRVRKRCQTHDKNKDLYYFTRPYITRHPENTLHSHTRNTRALHKTARQHPTIVVSTVPKLMYGE